MKLSRVDVLLVLLSLAVAAVLILLFRVVDPRAFDSFFAWPDGGVWSNIAASLLWAVPAGYAVLRRQARMHAEQLATLKGHHAEHMAEVRDHHQQVREALRGNGG